MKPAKQKIPLFLALTAALLATSPSSASPQQKVAVLEFHNYAGLTDPEVMLVTDLVRGAAVTILPRTTYLVMTRESIFELLPPGRELTDCVGECEVESGRNIGADYIVSGELIRFGESQSLRLSLKLFDTETSQLLATRIAKAGTVEGLERPIEEASVSLFRIIPMKKPVPGGAAEPGFQEGAIGEAGQAWSSGGGADVVVRFESDPSGAIVEIGDQPVCTTPCSRALGPGIHDVAMKKMKWLTKRRVVEVKVGMGAVSWNLKPDFGWLTVRSDPAGLDVSINGKVEGKTPVERREMAPGRYEVLVTDPRYYDRGRRVEIERGEDEVVDVALEPRRGEIRVEAVDVWMDAVEGDVYVDGEKAGRTYAPIAAIIGRHEVEVRSGRGSWSGSVEVEEKRVAVVEARVTGGSAAPGAGAYRVVKSSMGVEMVEIPAGRFIMGSPESEEGREDDERQHEVVISRPLLAAKHEVTQALWRIVMGNNSSDFKNCGEDCPVENVSWYDAVEFCNQLSEREGLTTAYRISGKNVIWNRSANGYRLPTEAEWEYACRAGTQSPFYTGGIMEEECGHDPALARAGWYCGNADSKTHSVGQKAPNAWGLYDMHGNVWEWCWDWYSDYPGGSVTDPAGPKSGSDRVGRGGSWRLYAHICRSASRNSDVPGARYHYQGFRLFRSK